MHYVYLLYSHGTKRYYIGETSDLKKRFFQHNSGLTQSTKAGVPWKLVYYEAYSSKESAKTREKKLKQYGKGLAILKQRIGLEV